MERTTSRAELASVRSLRGLICFSWAVPWCWFFSSVAIRGRFPSAVTRMRRDGACFHGLDN